MLGLPSMFVEAALLNILAVGAVIVAIIGVAAVFCVLPLIWNGRASDAPDGGGKGAMLSKTYVESRA